MAPIIRRYEIRLGNQRNLCGKERHPAPEFYRTQVFNQCGMGSDEVQSEIRLATSLSATTLIQMPETNTETYQETLRKLMNRVGVAILFFTTIAFGGLSLEGTAVILFGLGIIILPMNGIVQLCGTLISALLRLLISARSQQTYEVELEAGPKVVIWVVLLFQTFNLGWYIPGFLMLGMLLTAPRLFLMPTESSSESYTAVGGGGGGDGGGDGGGA